MGIRLEKDTILNWINEMGKFLRLVVDKWETGLNTADDQKEIEEGYVTFFKKEKDYFTSLSHDELKQYTVESLQDEQIRPLALLLMYDGLLSEDKDLLVKAKMLLEYYSAKTGNFSFEDVGHLATIEGKLR